MKAQPLPEPITPFGFLNINKPLGITSHDVVSKVRRVFGIKKVGHAGTLDPLATGVLIVCVGGATRLSEYVMHQTKTYRAQVKLGETTTTDDAEGDVIATHDATSITQDHVENVLSQFMGDIEQVPPMYSAIKQGGKKLYELARQGQTIERKARKVRIDALNVTEWNLPVFTLDVTCGSGTYIRSLARDVGMSLGVGGHLAGLIRTQSGRFNLEQSAMLDELATSDNPHQYLTPPAVALADYPTVTLNSTDVEHIVHGRRIERATLLEDELTFGYSEDGEFIAILKARRGNWYPHKVFSS